MSGTVETIMGANLAAAVREEPPYLSVSPKAAAFLKYSEEKYEEHDFWDAGEELRDRKIRILICRKAHSCATCRVEGTPHEIKKGEPALRETGIAEDVGRVASYSCLASAERWIASEEEEGLPL